MDKETIEYKQNYLRSEIIDAGYDPDEFTEYLSSEKGENDLNLDNWSFSQLEEIVRNFKLQFSQITNYNQNNEPKQYYYQENIPEISSGKEMKKKNDKKIINKAENILIDSQEINLRKAENILENINGIDNKITKKQNQQKIEIRKNNEKNTNYNLIENKQEIQEENILENNPYNNNENSQEHIKENNPYNNNENIQEKIIENNSDNNNENIQEKIIENNSDNNNENIQENNSNNNIEKNKENNTEKKNENIEKKIENNNIIEIQQDRNYISCKKQERNIFSDMSDIKIIITTPEYIKGSLFSFSYYQYTLLIPKLNSECIRKLSDFEWLQKKLLILFPATFFPPFPESSFFDKNTLDNVYKKVRDLNHYINSISQNVLIRSSKFFQDFLTLPLNEFQRKKKYYDNLSSPISMENFTTMEGIIDVTIDEKRDNICCSILSDIKNKNILYNNLDNALNNLILEFDVISNKIFEVSLAFEKLSNSYAFSLKGEKINKILNKFSNSFNNWGKNYMTQQIFFDEEIREVFKYISKEINNFNGLNEEFSCARINYMESKKLYESKNQEIVKKVEKDYQNNQICYGFILNRLYDEYARINIEHTNKIKNLQIFLFERKDSVFSDYLGLSKLMNMIYMIITIIVYKYKLENTQLEVENEIKLNSVEVSFSLAQLIIHIINNIQLDLFKIYKHYEIYNIINETLLLDNCTLDKNLEDDKNYLNIIKDNNSYPISFLVNNITNNLTNYTTENYLYQLKTDPLFSKVLNKISYLENKELNNEIKQKICFMIPILKSIIFREISFKKENSLLNNIFFLYNDYIFQYPPNNTTVSLLQNLENYSKNISLCKFDYYGRCFMDELKEKLLEQEKNINNINIIHILNKDMKIFSCLTLFNNTNQSVCIQNILYKKLDKLKDYKTKNNLLTLAKIDSQISIFFSSNINKTEFNNIYSNNNSILGNYSYSNDSILLFHILYYELFKYKPSFITKELINNLIIEYQNISNYIINNCTNTSLLKPINLELKLTYIDVNYNISGILDYNNGKIKQDTKVFLQITPIFLQNSEFDNKMIINLNSDKKDLFCFELNIFRFSTTAFDGRVFDIFLFKSFRNFYIFSFLLYFLISLNSTLFTKFLDSIFYPIILLTKHLKKKILLNGNKLIQNFQKENSEEKNKKNKEEEIINSLNPEMQNLIQLCKFLENILDMKKIIQTKEQIEIDFSLMNEIYSELSTNKEIINYGHFVSNFYFQKGKYEECSNTIKIIEDILDSEKKRIKNENENIEIEIFNILANISYANEFIKSNELFQNSNISNQKYYYDLIIISEKLYFMFAICLFFKAKKIKKELKVLLNEKSSKRSKSKKINLKKKIRDITLFKKNNINFQRTIDSKEGEIFENQKELILNFSKAGKYFKKSLDINKKFAINKIKSIIILIYLSKCYMQKNLFKKSESIDAIKNAIISMFNVNNHFIEMNNKIHFNPRIMLLINGIIFEQIIFNIAKINKKYNNEKLASQMFLNCLSISYFKTDNIQSKASKNLGNLIRYSLIENRNLLEYLHKIQFRLNSKIVKYQNQNENISKNIFLLFSNKLIDIIPTKIELCEVISNCIKNYLNINDNIWCNTFDFLKEFSNKKAKEVSKDFLIRILSQNINFKQEKFGMQNIIFKVNDIIEKISEEKKNIMKSSNILNTENNKNIIPEDENVIFDDNYIFQFILLSDYIFDSSKSKNKFKQLLNKNNISLYTFVFDEDDKNNQKNENHKFNRIIHNLKHIPEGVLIYVDNFFSIKLAFQNISRTYYKKNVFNINCELSKNIFLDYH